MLRKLAIALGAVAAFSSPSLAFGGGNFGGHLGGGGLGGGHLGGGHFGGGHFGHFNGGGFGGGDVVVADSCYRTVFTDFGPRRVCD